MSKIEKPFRFSGFEKGDEEANNLLDHEEELAAEAERIKSLKIGFRERLKQKQQPSGK